MVVVDDYSRLGWSFFLKRKFNVQVVFARFLADIGVRASPSLVVYMLGQRSSEFINPDSVGLLDRLGIRRECTPVGFPDHNGVAERRIAATLDIAMALCLDPPPPR